MGVTMIMVVVVMVVVVMVVVVMVIQNSLPSLGSALIFAQPDQELIFIYHRDAQRLRLGLF